MNISSIHQHLFDEGLERLEAYIASYDSKTSQHVLIGRQLDPLKAIAKFIKAGGRDGYINVPTGTGKTVMFLRFINAVRQRTLIVTSRIPIINQTFSQAEKFTTDLDFGRINGYIKEYGRLVTIITYDSFVSGVTNGTIKPDDYPWLILDEPHRALTELRAGVIKKFEHSIALGFTASPTYTEEKSVSGILSTEIYRMGIIEAVNEGFLCPFSIILAETETDLSQVRMSGKDFHLGDLTRAVNTENRNRAAVELYKSTPEFFGQLTVCHCVSIKHAKSVAQLFRRSGVSAAAIHSKMHPSVQVDTLNKFKAGRIKVLCNIDIVSEGFDMPNLVVCFNLRPTSSIVVATQRPRNLRPDPNNPEKFAYVVDFLDRGVIGKRTPISYAHIVQETFVVPQARFTSDAKRHYELAERAPTTIAGLKISFSKLEIFSVLENRKKQKTFEFIPFPEWEKQVRASGISKASEYSEKFKDATTHPNNPRLVYPEFKGWKRFFNRGSTSKYPPYESWKNEVIQKGITSYEEYLAEYSKHKGWPKSPYHVYKGNFKGFAVTFSSVLRKYTFDEFVERMAYYNVFTYEQYIKIVPDDPRLPRYPEQVYKIQLFE